MINKLSHSARRKLLMVFTGITLSYVREYIQYKTYFWKSITHFLGSSFVHYMAILLVGVISYVVSKSKKNYFIEQDETIPKHEVRMDEFLYYYCIVILVSCIFVFFIGHYTPGDLYDN